MSGGLYEFALHALLVLAAAWVAFASIVTLAVIYVALAGDRESQRSGEAARNNP